MAKCRGIHNPKRPPGVECGNRMQKFREFDVREIDEFGDCVDVDHDETEAKALINAGRRLGGDVKAVVVELHTGWHCPECGISSDEYTVLHAMGDKAALAEWGHE